MGFDFQTKSNARPASDYRSRGVRLRLFLVVGGLFFCIWLVTAVADPGLRSVFAPGQRSIAGGPPLTEAERTDAAVDTRLRPTDVEGADARPLTDFSAQRGPAIPERATQEQSAVERAWNHGWENVFLQLEQPDRDALFAGLRRVRNGKTPDDTSWRQVVSSLDKGWIEYQAIAFEPLEKLEKEEREKWLGVLDHVERRWVDDWRPRLERFLDAAASGPPNRSDAEQLQQLFDRFALDLVRDDALISRSAERPIWFRLLEQLSEMSPDELQRKSAGPIGYMQLFDQPRTYRGRLVTVRGTALQAYRIEERYEETDVDGYYVLTLRPAGGPARPIIIYALELPAGFPSVGPLSSDGRTTTLNEELECTGYFLKRMPYMARDGMNRAPLLLARVPRWSPPPQPTSPAAQNSRLLLTLLAARGAAGAVVIWIWRFSPGAATRSRHLDALPEQMGPLS
jgi:hypothetical protein